MAKRDYYEVLGLQKSANENEIKQAFRKLSRQYHPDMQSGKSEAERKKAEEKFKEIAEAYEVLSDKNKRSQYDKFGFSSSNSSSPFGGMDMNQFFRSHSSIFEELFGSNFNPFGFDHNSNRKNNKKTYSQPKPENGRNIQIDLKISFNEMVYGCTKEIDLNLSKECPECKGTGVEKGSKVEECPYCHGEGSITQQIQRGFMIQLMTTPCKHCNGQGYLIKQCKRCNGQKRVSTKKHLSLKIPQGINDKQILRFHDLGECGVYGGKNGVLFVNVSVEKSNLFERLQQKTKNNITDIMLKMPISPIVAALGGTIDIPGLYNYCKIDIPAQTQSGDEIVLNEKGLKDGKHQGNLIVKIVIDTLVDLNDEQKQLLDKLQTSLKPNNLKLMKKTSELARKYFN